MKKFTVFTVLLTVVVVVVGGEVIVNDYLPRFKKSPVTEDSEVNLPSSLDVSAAIETNVLGADIDYSKIPDEELDGLITEEIGVADDEFGDGFDGNGPFLPIPEENIALLEEELATEDSPSYSANSSALTDFEDENFVSFTTNAYLREDMIKSAGFANAYLEDEPTNGFLFKSIFIDDINDISVTKHVIRNQADIMAKVYVFRVGPLNSLNDVYETLKVRAAEGLDIEVNETNSYGDSSFFMNDNRRLDVAFLTVRFGSLIYAFSYPKDYHPQIKNLITLIGYEF